MKIKLIRETFKFRIGCNLAATSVSPLIARVISRSGPLGCVSFPPHCHICVSPKAVHSMEGGRG